MGLEARGSPVVPSTDAHSLDGTCDDESDVSSLTEAAGLGLINLARLPASGRPNPLLNRISKLQVSLSILPYIFIGL
ncbi:unnamed protein product [Protopolystoma xenopodis]|uniref:Uncharacterized protein n=1 Tax=Protopolystoma xenopodis TaxID=117903 RepID=A0A448X2C9_9PLAT|nr:unnamed protein product [Protopolystoma xenopodis]